jgi:hypothetical protein
LPTLRPCRSSRSPSRFLPARLRVARRRAPLPLVRVQAHPGLASATAALALAAPTAAATSAVRARASSTAAGRAKSCTGPRTRLPARSQAPGARSQATFVACAASSERPYPTAESNASNGPMHGPFAKLERKTATDIGRIVYCKEPGGGWCKQVLRARAGGTAHCSNTHCCACSPVPLSGPHGAIVPRARISGGALALQAQAGAWEPARPRALVRACVRPWWHARGGARWRKREADGECGWVPS